MSKMKTANNYQTGGYTKSKNKKVAKLPTGKPKSSSPTPTPAPGPSSRSSSRSSPGSSSVLLPGEIPLPFVLLNNTDLGDNPITEEVIESFQHLTKVRRFKNVTSKIEKYIYGDGHVQATRGMSAAAEVQFKTDRWVAFQNGVLIPAINDMLAQIPGSTQMLPLSPPIKVYTASQLPRVTNLEFSATNLYTKEEMVLPCPLQFYRAFNRTLLQPNAGKTGININVLPYNDSKKIFNIWLFLFLSGLQKLIVKVPRLYTNYGAGSKPTVRLYRGMNVPLNKSEEFWQSPELKSHAKSRSRSGSRSPLSPNVLNVYSTLAFSSFSTKLEAVCGTFTAGEPNVFVYEPRTPTLRKGIEFHLPCLKSVSDLPNEDEYLTFPAMTVIVFSKERQLQRSVELNEQCNPPVTATWIGITDLTGATAATLDLTLKRTESGGGNKNNRRTQKKRRN
jgi:hypothetical protein